MKKLFCIMLAVLLLTSMLTMAVSAAEAKRAWVRFPGATAKGEYAHTDVTVNEGETKYLVTNDQGQASASGANADNYNIKLEYPTGGTFTIYMKGATLKNRTVQAMQVGRVNHTGYANITGFPCILYIESDSSLQTSQPSSDRHSPHTIAFSNQAPITITGPGTLNVTSDAGIVLSCTTPLTIKDAKLNLRSDSPNAWSYMPAIWAKSAEVVIDNSVLDLYANNGPCLWSYDAHNDKVGDPFNITIKNGSKITCVSNAYSTENGVIGARGTITVDNSTVEITSPGGATTKGIKPFARKPVLVGVSAIAGSTPEKAGEYVEKKYSTYFYFKCAPGLELPTEPSEPKPTTPVDPKPTTPTEPKPTTPTTPDATTPDATTPDATTPDATTPDATTPDATTPTTPDATTPGATTPNATTPNATKPAATDPTTGNNNTTTTPNTDKNDTDKADDKGGIPVILWVVIGVVVAGGIAAAVVVILKKKKAA